MPYDRLASTLVNHSITSIKELIDRELKDIEFEKSTNERKWGQVFYFTLLPQKP